MAEAEDALNRAAEAMSEAESVDYPQAERWVRLADRVMDTRFRLRPIPYP